MQRLKNEMLLAVAACVCGGFSAQATTLSVDEGVTNVATTATYDTINVNGLLVISNAASSGTIVSMATNSTVNTATLTVGEKGNIVVGDYGCLRTYINRDQAKSIITLGGTNGFGMVTVGGKRINNDTYSFSQDTAHFYCGDLWTSTEPTSGIVDLVRINKGGAMIQTQRGDKILNSNTKCDARILFNGGFLSCVNGYGGNFPFQSSTGGLITSGGGKAIILASENGNPIDLRYQYGNVCYPASGKVKTSGTGSMKLYGRTGDIHHYGWDLNNVFEWGHLGHLDIENNFCIRCQGNNVLPCVANGGDVRLTGNVQYNYLDLYGTSQNLNGLWAAANSVVMNTSSTTATLTFGSARPDGELVVAKFSGNGDFNVVKVGEGTLTISNTANFAMLSVQAGTVKISKAPGNRYDFKSLRLGSGANLVLDGVVVHAKSVIDAGGTVTLLNGAQLLCELDVAERTLVDGSSVLASCCDSFVKTGDGELKCRTDSLLSPKLMHIAGGTMSFSRSYTTNHWLKFTFTKSFDSNYRFALGEIRITDAAGNDVAKGEKPFRLPSTDPVGAGGTDGSYVTNAAPDCAAKDMQPRSIWSSDLGWSYAEPSGGYRLRSPSALFDMQSWSGLNYTNSPCSSTKPKIFIVRLPANTEQVAKYMFKRGYAGVGNLPSDWTLHSSPDGVDWVLVDNKSGMSPPSSTTKPYDDVYWPIHTGTVPGAAGIAATSSVQVDDGATLDCSLVEDGQELGALVVDCELGGGTLKSVRFAESGVLSLTNFTAKKGGYVVPLSFVDVTDTDNLANWTVKVNGQTVSRKLAWQDGAIVIQKGGTMILLK